MDVIRFTSIIELGYIGKELPQYFRLKAGRSTGSYATSLQTHDGHDRRVPCEQINYDGLGTYYCKVFAVDKDGNETGGTEFVVNLVDPSDAVVAPSGARIVNNQ